VTIAATTKQSTSTTVQTTTKIASIDVDDSTECTWKARPCSDSTATMNELFVVLPELSSMLSLGGVTKSMGGVATELVVLDVVLESAIFAVLAVTVIVVVVAGVAATVTVLFGTRVVAMRTIVPSVEAALVFVMSWVVAILCLAVVVETFVVESLLKETVAAVVLGVIT